MVHAVRDLPIRHKLTMMVILASGGALLLACIALLSYELFAYREGMVRMLSVRSDIIGANSASALLFNDEAAAADTLAALKADSHVVSAGIYTRDNQAFATYGRSDKQRAVALRERFAEHPDGHWFESDGLILFRKIVFKGEAIGTVYIQSDLEEMHARFWQYLAIISVVLLASSSVALLISSRLQGKITQPLLHLVETAQTVSCEKDYSIRAVTESNDEMGVLVSAFNEMLAQIQQRDTALRKSSDELEQRIIERTAQLQHANMDLTQSEERFRNLANNISQLAWMADDQGWIFWYNQRWFDYSGTTLEEMQGWDWQKVHHPDHVKRVVDKIRHCFQTGEVWEDTFPLRGKDGHYRWFLSRAVPIRNEEGRVIRWFGTNTDVTEQRQAEEALRQAHGQLELRVQERTAELLKKTRDLETLLYVTSHDLREPLRGIENFSRMVHDRYADRLDDKGRDFLQRVVRGTQRMDQLMTDILTLSRVQRMELSAEDMECESLVTEALRRLDHKIKETGATVRVVEALPRWQGNRTWATQGVYNLITNALKFRRDGEAPEVEIASYHPTVEDGSVVGIMVRDRGPGVAPEHAERIFQLFQRAVGREVEGTGAGLAIVRQVAERHGGRAWVQAREGGGAEFILTFGATNRQKGGDTHVASTS